ncbi:putative ABC transporter B family member 8 [Acorus gramineus]|uniref:ABC transporter B family member 8 n=1 Tax=Acorus gramineus TaxID=55184 RepID=A0AAV9APT6_ACOGR|nr:putative ABC transporter B family member 8 [Acorus gramineus]
MERRKSSRSFHGIFRYADGTDMLLMLLGTLGSIGDGCSTNCLLVFASGVMNSLGYGETKQNHGDLMKDVGKYCLYFVYLGLTVLVVAFMEGYCWSRTSERQVLRMRYRYLEAILRQEVGFFDSQEATTSEIVNGISKDTSLIQEVLSEKVPIFLMHSSVFISGIAFSIYFSWKLSLVAFPLLLLLLIPGLLYGKYLLRLSQRSLSKYAKANAIVEQALGSVKTIYSFTAERGVVERFSSILDEVVRLEIGQGIAKGLAIGSTGLSFAIWAFMAWYGSRLVMYNGESGGRIYACGISFVLGGLSLGVALPELKHFAEASVAASRIFACIDRVPKIDVDTPDGQTLDGVRGEVCFERVRFAYPSRPDSPVLCDFDLHVPAGKTAALVGFSGSGKSTAVALLQRFYDVDAGAVTIDGVDVRKLRLAWARGVMGLVSQEHALFGASVAENIRFGKPGATDEEVIAAATAANAHNFIRQLPEGYETKIGERGALLSGGQKQRIAIARAVIKNPSILLLDEATSALDSESEKLVQLALDHASLGRTTLVVAHRLSTIRNADVIAVVARGTVVETGTHAELAHRPSGHYARLMKLQRQFSSLSQSDPFDPGSACSFPRSTPASFASPALRSDKPEPVPCTTAPPSLYRLFKLSSPEWKQCLVGSASAVVFGSIQPVYAFSIGGMIASFYLANHDAMKAAVRHYALIFASLSAASMLSNLSQHSAFARAGARITRRVRLRMLEKILTFEPAWFDEDRNSSGSLCSRLGRDASMVKTLLVDRASLAVQAATGVLVAASLGLAVSWRLALVMIASQPMIVLCYYLKRISLARASADLARAQDRSTQIAVEAVYNHRIVASFGCAPMVLRLFEGAQVGVQRRKAWVAGATMGMSPCLSFLSWALDFWYGGRLVMAGTVTAGDVFKTFFILVSTGKVIAEAGSMTSDLAKGADAVASVFEVVNRNSSIPPTSLDVFVMQGDSKEQRILGKIELKSVSFAYPCRPECPVLRGFSLEVKAGASVGLVGGSGCGKSTVIALIQRFYDVNRGSVTVDGVDVRELDLRRYRARTALVGQEPVMFSGTVRDNIALGNPDAKEEEIIEAARAANAHDFISSLKDGYATDCGERGAQLSGGQKQRIAIARAIVRGAAVLMLDEATSALDAESERAVQEALKRMMVGRTTVVVAHRLDSVKRLDSVAVVVEGRVAERGTYAQLMHKKGAFFNLVSLQK